MRKHMWYGFIIAVLLACLMEKCDGGSLPGATAADALELREKILARIAREAQ